MSKLESLEELFAGRHFDREVIILCVRWYLRFKLSLRDLVEMMAERGLSLAHTTIMPWVRHYTPEFEKRWRRSALAVGRSWRVDETYVKIKGEWCYLYRAVDRAGRTVDFRLSDRRDISAAKAFFRKAIKNHQRPPQTITLDGYAASHRAVRELKAEGSASTDTKLRSSKYLTDIFDKVFLPVHAIFCLPRANRVAKSGCWDVSPPRAYDERVRLAAPVRLGGVVCQLATKRV
jgi:transposase-like protein